MTRKQWWDVGAGIALVVALLVGGTVWYRQQREARLQREMHSALGGVDGGAVARLIAEGARPATIGRNGTTVLMSAASADDLSLAQRALQAGVDVNAGTISGRQTALMA